MSDIVLHSFEALASADGGHACVLLRIDSASRVVVWTGSLRADALALPADTLTERDFLTLDVQYLDSCDLVWARLRGPRHAALVSDLRHRLRAWPSPTAQRPVAPDPMIGLVGDAVRRERWLSLMGVLAKSLHVGRRVRVAR
jgi:hypothetical protein